MRPPGPSAVTVVSAAVLVAALAGIAWLVAPRGGAPRRAPGSSGDAARPTARAGDDVAPARATPAAIHGSPRRAAGAPVPLAPDQGGLAGPAATAGGFGGPLADDPSPAPDPTLDPYAGHTGLAAFPPLGTKPIQRGIVVPEGFELPPGYVRHYQVTDDGRMLPPILRFHPDHAPLDASGHPATRPADLVVPPEQAPPGMPIQLLDPETAP